MAKETSARIAKIAGRALDDPYNISGTDIKALAASALAQREIEVAAKKVSPRWGKLSKKRKTMFEQACSEMIPRYIYTLALNIMEDVN
jgi:hypothetical protein